MENQVNGFAVLKDLYVTNNDFREIMEWLNNPIARNMDLVQSEYFMQYDYLFKGKQICIPTGYMRENIIRELHSSVLVGHFGKDKMLGLI